MWGTKEGATALSRSTFGEGTAGDILIVICGDRLDSTLVSLGSYMAKGAKRKACFLHVIEVPRALLLTSILIQESERADKLLNGAMEVARRIGCETHAQVVQAREAGPAIVDEAKEHQFALLLLGLVRNTRQIPSDFDKTVAYVLANAPCRVWLVQD